MIKMGFITIKFKLIFFCKLYKVLLYTYKKKLFCFDLAQDQFIHRVDFPFKLFFEILRSKFVSVGRWTIKSKIMNRLNTLGRLTNNPMNCPLNQVKISFICATLHPNTPATTCTAAPPLLFYNITTLFIACQVFQFCIVWKFIWKNIIHYFDGLCKNPQSSFNFNKITSSYFLHSPTDPGKY